MPIRAPRHAAAAHRSALPAARKPRKSAVHATALSYMNQLG
jgi:hypothetical protein